VRVAYNVSHLLSAEHNQFVAATVSSQHVTCDAETQQTSITLATCCHKPWR